MQIASKQCLWTEGINGTVVEVEMTATSGKYRIVFKGISNIGFRTLDGHPQCQYDPCILSVVDYIGQITGSRSAAFKRATNLEKFICLKLRGLVRRQAPHSLLRRWDGRQTMADTDEIRIVTPARLDYEPVASFVEMIFESDARERHVGLENRVGEHNLARIILDPNTFVTCPRMYPARIGAYT